MKKMSSKYSKKIRYLFLGLIFLIGGILPLISSADALSLWEVSEDRNLPSIILGEQVSLGYEQALKENYHGLKIKRVPQGEFVRYMDSKYAPVMELSEFQAIPMLKAQKIKSWNPHYETAIVIAVDRDRISDEIEGWRDLQDGDYPIYIENMQEGISAMAIGLDEGFRSITTGVRPKQKIHRKDVFDMSNTMSLLKDLKRNQRLIKTRGTEKGLFVTAPVVILDESRLSHLKKQGSNIEIIVPKEGTLAIRRGLGVQYNKKYPKHSEAVEKMIHMSLDRMSRSMVENGLRPINEKFFLKYPSPVDQYRRAYYIKDIEKYNAHYLKLYSKYRREAEELWDYASITGLGPSIDYMIVMIIVVLWMSFIRMRIVDEIVWKFMSRIFFWLIIWLLIRLIQYLIITSSMERWMWYMYYIPFISILTSWFILCCELSAAERILEYKGIIIMFSLLLIGVVLTNDWHQMVFRFADYLNAWKEEYRYGILYYLMSLWMFLLPIVGTSLLFFHRAAKVEKIRLWMPVLVLLLAFIYHTLYMMGISAVENTDVTKIYIFLICFFIESMLYVRLIDSNSSYRVFFENTSQNIYLLSKKQEVIMKTNVAETLPQGIKDISFARVENINQFLHPKEGVYYNLGVLRGGYALWEEDLSHIIQMKKELQKNAKELRQKNQIILQDYQAKKTLYRIRIRKQLMDEIEKAIADKVDAISNIADTLSEGVSDNEKYIIRKKITYIKMMVSYCKRISNFIMISQQDDVIPMEELVKALRETLQDSEVAGIEYALILQEEGKILVEDALFIYEYIYTMIEKSMSYRKPLAFINLSVRDQKIRMKLVISAEQEKIRPEFFAIGEELRTSMTHKGYAQHMELEHNSLEILLFASDRA